MAKKTAQPPKKNPAAQALGKLRWQGFTPEQRQEFAQRAARLAWKGKRGAQRRAAIAERKAAGRNLAGRPLDPDRCPCGKFTRARAAQRKHHCQAA